MAKFFVFLFLVATFIGETWASLFQDDLQHQAFPLPPISSSIVHTIITLEEGDRQTIKASIQHIHNYLYPSSQDYLENHLEKVFHIILKCYFLDGEMRYIEKIIENLEGKVLNESKCLLFMMHLTACYTARNLSVLFLSQAQSLQELINDRESIFPAKEALENPNVQFIHGLFEQQERFFAKITLWKSETMLPWFRRYPCAKQKWILREVPLFNINFNEHGLQKKDVFVKNSLGYETTALIYDKENLLPCVLQTHHIQDQNIYCIDELASIEGTWVLFYAPHQMQSILHALKRKRMQAGLIEQ